MNRKRIFILVATLTIAVVCGFGVRYFQPGHYSQPPSRHEAVARAYELEDQKLPLQKGHVLFYGSSSIVAWQSLQRDMDPLKVIQRGFGGINLNDALHFLPRIVLPHQPRALVVYVGENDIMERISAKRFLQKFEVFTAAVWQTLPDTRIYFISIKPSSKRWSSWSEMAKLNQLIKQRCVMDERLYYIDVATSLLNVDQSLKHDLFAEDGIHLNEKGYRVWAQQIKPILLSRELPRAESASCMYCKYRVYSQSRLLLTSINGVLSNQPLAR